MPLMPQSKASGLYVAFGICVMMSCVPNMQVQDFALIFSSIFVTVIYRLRKKWAPDSLEYHHAVFIIRTFWMWSMLFLIGLIGAGIMIYQLGDIHMLTDWATTATDRIAAGETNLDASLNTVIDDYFAKNFDLIVRMLIIWLIPAQLYVGFGIAKGLSRAQKGYRI